MDDTSKTRSQLIEELQRLRADLAACRERRSREQLSGGASTFEDIHRELQHIGHAVGTAHEITQRKETEQELKRVHAFLDEALASSQHAFYRYDADRDRMDYFGSATTELFGQPIVRLTGRPLEEAMQAVHPDDRQAVLDGFGRACREHPGQRVPVELKYRRQSSPNEWAWVRNRAVVVSDADGKVVRVVGSVVDITGYRQAEIKGQDWVNVLYPPEVREAVRGRLYESLARESTSEYISCIQTGSGRTRTIEWLSVPIGPEEDHGRGR